MGADHSHRIAWLPCAADGEGDDRAGVASEVVFTAGLESRVPGVAFLRRDAMVSTLMSLCMLGAVITFICLKPAFLHSYQYANLTSGLEAHTQGGALQSARRGKLYNTVSNGIA